MTGEGGAGPGRALADRRTALWLAAVAALAYLPFNHCHFAGTDETGVFDTARSLVVDGDLAIEPGRHVFRGRDGRHYSHFALGPAWLATPLVALGELAGRVVPGAWGARLWEREAAAESLHTEEGPAIFFASAWAPLASGLLVGLFFAFERRLGASPRSALAAAALLGGASYVATHSVFFLRHTSEALAILGCLYALGRFREAGGAGWLAVASLAASSLVLIRVPAAVAGPALAGALAFAWWRAREEGRAPSDARAALAVLGPALAVAALHLATNQWRWGTWVASPMLSQSFLLRGSLLEGGAGLLLSPGAGLFVYSPLLALLPATWPRFWREHRAEAVTVLALCASFLLLCARFEFWHGLWSAPGPRYLFALVPLLMLPLGPWLDAPRTRAMGGLLAGLAGLGALVQIGLVSAVWSRAVQLVGYGTDHGWRFLFEPLRSPILACWRAVAEGQIDVWLWALASGVPGRPAQPLLAGLLLAAWLAAFAFAARRLRLAFRAGLR